MNAGASELILTEQTLFKILEIQRNSPKTILSYKYLADMHSLLQDSILENFTPIVSP